MENILLPAPRTFFKKAKHEINRVKKATLKKLSKFKQTGQLITITSPALGEGEFVSRVEDVYTNGAEDVVVIKWFDRNNFAYLTHLLVEEFFLINKPAVVRF